MLFCRQNRREVNKEKIVNELLDNLVVPEGMTRDAAWNKLNSRIQTQRSETKVIPMRKKWLPAVGAAAGLILILWFGFGEEEILVSSLNDRIEHVLPDGSVVSLNKGSEIKYDEDNWADERSVWLEGEAFFDVEKGSEFTVRSSRGEVSVLGTSFNIFSRDGFYEVDCYSGKVRVDSEEDQTLLTKGLSTKIKDGKLLPEFENSLVKPDWKNNTFHFEGMNVKRVFTEIENEFGVEIEYNNEEELEVAASHSIVSLAQTLDVVCKSVGLTYKIEGKNILIKK